ncbi:MAG: hypothetical protein P0Y55_09860 [Candidatus Cohnella colombiensis]|uniref:Uncharacterized protein n=1 Tax=Candidatus Cohnella colombiensis TaxID=3121368 RepID=A0AA95JAE3_9BACL|nr:MAG: hypothetical protein P0Y55_09860 [Cohnella sp.]
MAKAKKKTKLKSERFQPQMKIVTVDKCIVCPTPCSRGIAYRDRMKEPGAIGYGVPCVLTLPSPSSSRK